MYKIVTTEEGALMEWLLIFQLIVASPEQHGPIRLEERIVLPNERICYGLATYLEEELAKPEHHVPNLPGTKFGTIHCLKVRRA